MVNDNSNKSSKDEIPHETENLIKEAEQTLKNNEDKGLSEIKKSTEELAEFSNEQSLKLSELVKNREKEIKNLNNEEILLERNQIQNDIHDNQKLIIEEYKDNNNKLKSDLDKLQNEVEELNSSNRKFLINNDELKKTISRYIKHNKNLQISLNNLKKIETEFLDSKSKIIKMTEQIKFYRDDNTRLSNEIINIKKKYEIVKNNFDAVDKEKNDIFNQIQELNNSITSSNIVGTPFVKEIINEDSINSKVLNDISKNNTKEEKFFLNDNDDLDNEINEIFK